MSAAELQSLQDAGRGPARSGSRLGQLHRSPWTRPRSSMEPPPRPRLSAAARAFPRHLPRYPRSYPVGRGPARVRRLEWPSRLWQRRSPPDHIYTAIDATSEGYLSAILIAMSLRELRTATGTAFQGEFHRRIHEFGYRHGHKWEALDFKMLFDRLYLKRSVLQVAGNRNEDLVASAT